MAQEYSSEDLAKSIQKFFKGDVAFDEETLEKYSRDTSLFKVRPKLVVFPKNSKDVENLVAFVAKNKKKYPHLSVTGRSAGTDMTGGPLNESIIVEFYKYFNHADVDEKGLVATVEPGVYYRDFEKKTLPKHITYPSYPASKSIAALGGIVMNNSGGEKTLRYGQTRDYVKEVHMVLADGKERVFGEVTIEEAKKKAKQKDLEGEIYKKMLDLLEKNYDVIKKAKPDVSKNSAGYALWEIYDKENKTFNLAQMFVGSQGTLGMLTKAKIKLVKQKMHERLIVLFFKDWSTFPETVNRLMPYEPESLETFDDATLKLGLRFMPEIAQKAGSSFIPFALQFAPEFLIGVKMLGLPKLIILVELAEDTKEELDQKTANIVTELQKEKITHRVLYDNKEAEKYWIMRRQSFALLRQHVKGKQTAPFIEDFIVKPEKLPEFLPQVLKILKDHGIVANIAGHAGNGNFHIIPLMDLTKQSEKDKIPQVADLIYPLIIKYGGSITAEHNDGILRSPYLKEMYGEKVYKLFEETKKICDPDNIFNPGKKVNSSKEYLASHISAK